MKTNVRLCRRVAAVAAVTIATVGVTSSSSVSAEPGNCSISGVVCMNAVGVTGFVNGASGSTFRFATSDPDLRNNTYSGAGVGAVNNNVESVRNRNANFSYACGYDGLSNTGASLWLIDFASSPGFVDVVQGTSSFRYRNISPATCS
jgi:hypothetical protein